MPTAVETGPPVDFLIDRADWQSSRFRAAPLPAELAPGQALLRVDRFAFTANDISYALAGDMLGYWRFFPAEPGWGRLPVMGFADVLESRHRDVSPGERVFGFFPMSTHLVVEVGEASAEQFVDAAEHRRDTALAYRQILRSAADPQYEASREDAILLLRGLFLTSFLVDDFLADNGDFAGRSFVVSSASSKTAIALAFSLSRRRPGRVIGLTSERNRDFVARLGCYDEVLPYAAIETLDPRTRTVFVDHSGDAGVVNPLHRHLGDALKHSAVVGATHWSGERPSRILPGPTPTFFFAPAQLEKRRTEWGAAGFQARLGEAWRSFLAFSDGWLRVVRGHGSAAVERVYREVLQGGARPDEGHVLSLWEEAALGLSLGERGDSR